MHYTSRKGMYLFMYLLALILVLGQVRMIAMFLLHFKQTLGQIKTSRGNG